jgi:hypothetical protein
VDVNPQGVLLDDRAFPYVCDQFVLADELSRTPDQFLDDLERARADRTARPWARSSRRSVSTSHDPFS